jgi:hypothetical protein
MTPTWDREDAREPEPDATAGAVTGRADAPTGSRGGVRPWLRAVTAAGERLRRFVAELLESDEEHLAHELREWSRSIPGTVPIAMARAGGPVTVAGEVRRITIFPGDRYDDVVITLYDGSGELLIILPRAPSLRSLETGSRIVARGMITEVDGVRRMIDPVLERVGDDGWEELPRRTELIWPGRELGSATGGGERRT